MNFGLVLCMQNCKRPKTLHPVAFPTSTIDLTQTHLNCSHYLRNGAGLGFRGVSLFTIVSLVAEIWYFDIWDLNTGDF